MNYISASKPQSEKTKAEILKVGKGHQVLDLNKAVLEQQPSSIALVAFTTDIAKATGLSQNALKGIAIVADTTFQQLIDKVGELAADEAVKAKKKASSGTDAEDAANAAAEKAAALEKTPAAAAVDETASTVPKLTPAEFFKETGFEHLAASLTTNWDACMAAVNEGRTQTLNFLKEAGVSKLQERQKLATALSKAKREQRI